MSFSDYHNVMETSEIQTRPIYGIRSFSQQVRCERRQIKGIRRGFKSLRVVFKKRLATKYKHE